VSFSLLSDPAGLTYQEAVAACATIAPGSPCQTELMLAEYMDAVLPLLPSSLDSPYDYIRLQGIGSFLTYYNLDGSIVNFENIPAADGDMPYYEDDVNATLWFTLYDRRLGGDMPITWPSPYQLCQARC
jgi:hypothetical protein